MSSVWVFVLVWEKGGGGDIKKGGKGGGYTSFLQVSPLNGGVGVWAGVGNRL